MPVGRTNRREFIAVLGGAAAWPLASRAQKQTRLYRIFWVSTQSQPDPFLDGFREGLRARGYVEGQDVEFELHYAAGDPAVLRQVVSDLKQGNIDLAVSSGPATRAMTAVTDVPVLFALSGDPVELGVVKSLGQPGGNFTGSTFLSLELAGKRVELLKDIFPKLRTLAVLSNTDHPGEQSEWRATQQATQGLGIDPVYVPFFGVREFDKALDGGKQCARRRDTRLPGTRDAGSSDQTCRVRHLATATFDVRMERILRGRRTFELWREPARNLFFACNLCRQDLTRRKSRQSSR